MTIEAARLAVVVSANTKKAEQGLKSFNSRMNASARTLAGIGATATAGITLPLLAVGKAVFDVGVSFESAFAGVTKTVSGTAEEMAVLRDGIRDMARNMPATVEEISSVAEAAGALGIAKENILDFTRTMIDLGETTDLTADQAATDLARFANITGMAQTEFDRLGSTIVALGNAGASTESEIVAMSMRIAAAGTTIGMSQAEIVGWASAMSSVGIAAEAGGTAISTIMIDIASAVATGSDALDKFAEVAGVSSTKFTELFNTDSSAAIQLFIEGLGKIDAAGGNVFATLEELGFADVRVRDTLLRLSGAGTLVADSINIANKAWEENTALANEANIRYQTTESQLTIMNNRMRDLGITLSDIGKGAFAPLIVGLNQFLLSLDTGLQTLAETNPALIQLSLGFAAAAAAIGPLILIMSGIVAALASPLLPIGLLIIGIVALGAAWAANIGGLQTATEPVLTAVTSAFNTAKTSIENFVAGVTTAFEGVTFPTLEELWADFQAGDADLIANKIRDAAYTVMVNLDTELNITANAGQLQKNIQQAISQAFGNAGTDVANAAAAKVDTANWEVISAGIINNLNAQTAKVQDALKGGEAGELGEAAGARVRSVILEITELRQQMNQAGLELNKSLSEAVNTALTGITWSGIAEALGNLEASIYQTISEFVFSFGKGLMGGDSFNSGRPAAFTNGLNMGSPDREFTWPDYPIFEWPSFPSLDSLGFSWPSFPSLESLGFEWPKITAPDWLNSLLGALGMGGGGGGGAGLQGGRGAPGGGAMEPFPDEADLGRAGKTFRYSLRPDTAGAGMESPDWAAIIKSPEWATILTQQPEWATIITQQPEWTTIIKALAWESFVMPLEWAAFVTNLVWESFITRLDWNTYVSDMTWDNYVGELSWGEYIPSIDWGRFIPALNRPAADTGGAAPVVAAGFSMPGTSRYVSAAGVSMASAGGITVNVNVASLNNDMDIESLAVKVANKFRQKMR